VHNLSGIKIPTGRAMCCAPGVDSSFVEGMTLRLRTAHPGVFVLVNALTDLSWFLVISVVPSVFAGSRIPAISPLLVTPLARIKLCHRSSHPFVERCICEESSIFRAWDGSAESISRPLRPSFESCDARLSSPILGRGSRVRLPIGS